MAKSYKFTIEIEVSAETVADGLDLSNEAVLASYMEKGFSHCHVSTGSYATVNPYGYGKVSVRCIKAPSADRIAKEQGYESAEQRAKVKRTYFKKVLKGGSKGTI